MTVAPIKQCWIVEICETEGQVKAILKFKLVVTVKIVRYLVLTHPSVLFVD